MEQKSSRKPPVFGMKTTMEKWDMFNISWCGIFLQQ